ncbi:carboxypeptidase regulatory-like domain-containing protein [Thiospirochaeta perfilievii]|uniref:Carboxypeptidase regulatory-like domain-containing protein n=1 Tax=Thiospirochaeta perfilievii TaxID=252967 RepID=A0A5C1Q846_9SPIO|nr:carboxypeptidase-like regulatory domain-containing protein [Thiospirochaeta perfilievii]QEN04215.1 carboxypeptidase regulatory-like domain-containing protein [Thiospirochaeta perfilievii]
MIKIYNLVIVIIILGSISCVSNNNRSSTLSNSLLGILYDNDNNPLNNIDLEFINSELETVTTTTDIDGKFFIPELEFGKYKIIIRNKIMNQTVEIEHYSIENILILRVKTITDLILDLEVCLEKSDFDRSKLLISKIEEIDKDNEFFIYLKGIYHYKIDEMDQSETLLLTLEGRDYAYVYLLLADIYQYHKSTPNRAIYYLKKFLNIEQDKIIYKRLEELESDN